MSIFKLLSSVDKFYYLNSSLLSKYAMQPAEEEKKFKIEKEYSPKELESINQKKIKLINLNNSFFKDLKAKLLDLHSRKCLVENVDRGKEILPEKEVISSFEKIKRSIELVYLKYNNLMSNFLHKNNSFMDKELITIRVNTQDKLSPGSRLWDDNYKSISFDVHEGDTKFYLSKVNIYYDHEIKNFFESLERADKNINYVIDDLITKIENLISKLKINELNILDKFFVGINKEVRNWRTLPDNRYDKNHNNAKTFLDVAHKTLNLIKKYPKAYKYALIHMNTSDISYVHNVNNYPDVTPNTTTNNNRWGVWDLVNEYEESGGPEKLNKFFSILENFKNEKNIESVIAAFSSYDHTKYTMFLFQNNFFILKILQNFNFDLREVVYISQDTLFSIEYLDKIITLYNHYGNKIYSKDKLKFFAILPHDYSTDPKLNLENLSDDQIINSTKDFTIFTKNPDKNAKILYKAYQKYPELKAMIVSSSAKGIRKNYRSLMRLIFDVLKADINWFNKDFSTKIADLMNAISVLDVASIGINVVEEYFADKINTKPESIKSFAMKGYSLQKIYHNLGKDNLFLEQGPLVIKILFDPKIDLERGLTKKYITFLLNDKAHNIIDEVKNSNKYDEVLSKIKINKNELLSNYDSIMKDGPSASNQSILYEIDSIIVLLQINIQGKAWLQLKEDKDAKLFDLNYKVGDFKFEVLPDGSVQHFLIGAATNCCQRLGGGEGEYAAIDSFLNKFAGVLVLRDKANKVVAQSYFHYVPEDNGFILDNVEVSPLGKDRSLLNALYANLGQILKREYHISYFKCGMTYNKLDNTMFEISSMEDDPRTYRYDRIYSDFDHDEHLDLLKPKFKAKQLEYTKLVTHAYFSRIMFKKYSNYLRF